VLPLSQKEKRRWPRWFSSQLCTLVNAGEARERAREEAAVGAVGHGCVENAAAGTCDARKEQQRRGRCGCKAHRFFPA